MKEKNKTLHFLSLGLALGVCLTALNAAAQEIPVVDNVTPPTPVDFPGRASLSEVKEAPLPSLADSVIKEPAPMERVVSKKELPSEQLLGRITSEVFHEMADLERGNVFLKLQAQREQLKNDLEALKAKYREQRLAEIEKREDVIRTRVKWQQEQEQIRQEILEKKLKTELLEKQLEEAEIAKEDLLPLEKEKKKEVKVETPATQEAPKVEQVVQPVEEVVEEEIEQEETTPQPVIQQIVDIKGMKGRLTARIIDNNGKTQTLKVGTTLSSGHIVKSINKADIVLEKDGVAEVYNIEELASLKTSKEELSDEDVEE